ncbi:hypothetical protein [Nocardia sp. NPDC056100]|uniref:hypothetical protein n=1 Tax=Nocardia sp. NPDC056100 TaxID=3345712 RepID=UPI0035D7D740
MDVGGFFKNLAGSAAVGIVGAVASKLVTATPTGRAIMGLVGGVVGGVSAYMTNGHNLGNAFLTGALDGVMAGALGKFPAIRGVGKVGKVTGPVIKRGIPIGIAHSVGLGFAPPSGSSGDEKKGPISIPTEPLAMPA